MLNVDLNTHVIEAMRRCPLFAAMRDEEFNRILACAHLVQLHAEQMLFHQGEALTRVYFVYTGAVKLGRITRKGEEKIIEVVQNGRTFAEGVLFDGVPQYPVSATALNPSTLVGVSADGLLALLRGSPDLCLSMLAHLSRRLHWMLNELDKQTLHNASFRIIDYFLNQLDRHGKTDGHSDHELQLNIPKRDIASRLSIKPETFSRALKSLTVRGLIDIKDNRVTLKNVRNLRHMLDLEMI